MALRHNILASYVSRAYVMIVGLAVVPIYIQYMGAEVYGLVGFFAILQVGFNLLDLGLTPTVAREAARYKGGAISSLEFRRLFRALNALFIGIAFAGGLLLFLISGLVAETWLNLDELASDDVTQAVQIMAVCVALRWLGGLYRGVISGSEKLVWLGGYDAMAASMRFLGVFISMSVWGYSAGVFFWHQLAVALLELGFLLLKCRMLLPSHRDIPEPIGWSLRAIRSLLRLSFSMAFVAVVWALITQSDKLILSGILPLVDYGYFTLAVVVASGILMVSDPLITSALPRMSRLHAAGDDAGVYRLYRTVTQAISVLAGAGAASLAVATESVLYAWTGNRILVEAVAPILRLYAIGNGMLALAAFPYYLQYVKGNLNYHLIGTGLMAVIFVPNIIWIGMKSGGIGVAWVWVVMNAVYLLLWGGYVHSKIAPNLARSWLFNDVLGIMFPIFLVAIVFGLVPPDPESRLGALLHFCFVAIGCVMAGVLAAPQLRTLLWRYLRSVYP